MRIPKTSLAVLAGLAVCLVPLHAQIKEPSAAKNRQIVKVALKLLEKHHVSRHSFDDELSQRVFDSLFESLDPAKMYFLKPDIDEFAYLNTKLDDLAKAGDTSPAQLIVDRMQLRSSQSMEMVEELLKGDFDFERDESVVSDADKREYAKDSEELRDRWRRELKWRILVQEARDSEQDNSTDEPIIAPEQGTPQEKVLQEYRRRHRRLNEMRGEKVFEWYVNALAKAYDPHTSYMSASTMEEFMIHVRSNLQGIGAELREQGDYVYITRIMDGGGASRCKEIANGDQVLEVSQDGEKWASAYQLSSSDLADMIRGKAGTIVHLKLRSKSGEEKLAVIERSRVELKRQQASGQVVEVDNQDTGGSKLKVGYVKLPGFYQDGETRRQGVREYRSCSRDVQKLLAQFREADAQAVILDLRGNGGGILDEAIRLAGLFIDKGPIVQVKQPGADRRVYRDPDAGVDWDGPLVVLTNKYSASASEIVAGALQDYGRAIVIGDTQTHGKGTVQQPIDIAQQLFGISRYAGSMGSLKLTIQKYYLPNGQSTQQTGVASGIVIPFSLSQLADGENELSHAIANDSTDSVAHDQYELASKSLLNQLQQATALRSKENETFQQTQSRIETVKRQREAGEVSINRKSFVEYIKRLNENNEEDDDNTSSDPNEQPKFPSGEYDQEVLRIVGDYIKGLSERKAG